MDRTRIPRNLFVSVMALAGGVVGGFIHSRLSPSTAVRAQSPSAIRVTALELVDGAGNRVGYLGTDAKRNSSLAFFDTRGKKRAEFGLGGGESPRLDINGPDEDTLLTLDLGQQAKPRLMMSDPDFSGRVYLGVAEPDAPDPSWKYDNWVLRFTGNRTRPLAVIGMTASGSGGVAVYDQSGRRWQTPLK